MIRRFRPHAIGGTFFAFQDIITGVSGIMLLVVLLLICFKHREESVSFAEDGSDSQHVFQQNLAALDLEILDLQQKRDNLRRQEKQQAEQKQVNREFQAYAALQQQTEQACSDRRLELRKLELEVSQLERDLSVSDALEREWLVLQQQLAEKRRALSHARLQRTVSARGQQKIIILDCAKARWVLQQPGALPQRLGEADLRNPTLAWQELQAFLQTLDTADTLLILSIRPSGGGFADALVEKIRTLVPELAVAVEPMPSETLGGFVL